MFQSRGFGKIGIPQCVLWPVRCLSYFGPSILCESAMFQMVSSLSINKIYVEPKFEISSHLFSAFIVYTVLYK